MYQTTSGTIDLNQATKHCSSSLVCSNMIGDELP